MFKYISLFITILSDLLKIDEPIKKPIAYKFTLVALFAVAVTLTEMQLQLQA